MYTLKDLTIHADVRKWYTVYMEVMAVLGGSNHIIPLAHEASD